MNFSMAWSSTSQTFRCPVALRGRHGGVRLAQLQGRAYDGAGAPADVQGGFDELTVEDLPVGGPSPRHSRKRCGVSA